MTPALRISVGQYSDRGRKPRNQDFHGAMIPSGAPLATKGVAVALADGISTSEVSHIASESAVKGFLEDYYCTSEAWSVKTSAQRVLVALNSWLHAQNRRSEFRFERDRGYVCTLSALVVKSNTAHLFHVGDGRIYRASGGALERLTRDHRVVLSAQQSYLSRALGIDEQLEIDYRALPVEAGELFLLCTDGVHEHVPDEFVVAMISAPGADLDRAARAIADEALRRGSTDNLTVQLLRVDALPDPDAGEVLLRSEALPPAPVLQPRQQFDGYRIERELHGSSRSHVYLATDLECDEAVVLKTPSIDLRGDPAYLERFAMEEWIARRIHSPHVLRPAPSRRGRRHLYVATEYVEGQTLTQWLTDHPRPDLGQVRDIVGQIARGLRAFHRLEMLHQDLRPDNVMIDRRGTVKIIDFGATRVAGVAEASPASGLPAIPGTAPYTAPEYFLGAAGSARSDLFSLGVIAYRMLSGRLPYGTEVAKCRTAAHQRRLRYATLPEVGRRIPEWVDGAVRKAVHPDPTRRHADVSEFVYDLTHPNAEFLRRARSPLIERDPVSFWKGVSLVLALLLLALLAFAPTRL